MWVSRPDRLQSQPFNRSSQLKIDQVSDVHLGSIIFEASHFIGLVILQAKQNSSSRAVIAGAAAKD